MLKSVADLPTEFWLDSYGVSVSSSFLLLRTFYRDHHDDDDHTSGHFIRQVILRAVCMLIWIGAMRNSSQIMDNESLMGTFLTSSAGHCLLRVLIPMKSRAERQQQQQPSIINPNQNNLTPTAEASCCLVVIIPTTRRELNIILSVAMFVNHPNSNLLSRDCCCCC